MKLGLSLSLAGCVAALGLAACGSKEAAALMPGTGGAAAACDVLSADIAKKYLGPEAQLRRNAQPNSHMTQCQYGDDNGVITVMTGPWALLYDKSSDDKPVAGLGDEAWSSFSGLYVRKGDKGVSIDVIVDSGDFWGQAATDEENKTIDAEKKVAPDIVAKL